MSIKRIGYACLNLDIDGNYKTCRKKNLSKENIDNLVKNNLSVLKEMAIYNKKNNIKLYRISSDLVPFGSLILEDYCVIDTFQEELDEIKDIFEKTKQRFSMHPGQYTVINSPREEVVKNSVDDLIYHYNILKALGGDSKNKIVLHIGGRYDDKEKSIERFIENYNKLPDYLKDVLVIENDHSIYNIEDLLYISKKTNAPVIFDYFHHIINRPVEDKGIDYYIEKVEKTWLDKDGRMILHYSQQGRDKKIGSHSDTIYLDEFFNFSKEIRQDYDLMLEVKDKNRSAIKIENILNTSKKNLEKEWARYKYLILSKSQNIYKEIRQYLKEEKVEGKIFYKYIEEAMSLEENKGEVVNSYTHMWGYFKDKVDKTEREKFEKLINDYRSDKIEKEKILKHFTKLLNKYPNNYLEDSYILRF